MMVDKLIHNTFAIIFPLLLPKQQEIEINYTCYIHYSKSMFLLGLIQIFCRKFSNRRDNQIYNILSYLLKFLFLYQIGITFLHFSDYKSSISFVIGMVIFYLYGIQFRQQIKVSGLNDFLFIIIISQMLLSLSEMIAYKEWSFRTISLFSPINLLCFVQQLMFHAYINETPQMIENLEQSQKQFVSAYKILGKEDTFRLTIFIYIYICVFLATISHQKRSFMSLIPVILLSNKFWGVLKYFNDKIQKIIPTLHLLLYVDIFDRIVQLKLFDIINTFINTQLNLFFNFYNAYLAFKQGDTVRIWASSIRYEEYAFLLLIISDSESFYV